MDRLTKLAHFIPVRMTMSMQQLVKLYTDNIVKLHGPPISIVSDRDARFTSRIWKEFQDAMGTELKFSTTFHPQTDGQLERIIQTLKDMMRACVLEFKINWDDHLPLIEFAYNNSYHSSIDMAPYKALYGRRCRTPVCWDATGEARLLGPEIVQHMAEQVKIIRAKLKAIQDR